MEGIVIKRHLLRFKLLIGLIIGLSLLIPGIMVSMFMFTPLPWDCPWMNATALALMSIPPLLGLALATYFFHLAPVIRIKDGHIYFNQKDVYNLDDIIGGNIAGKGRSYIWKRNGLEGTLISFKEGKDKCLYDFFYDNSWELKLFLHQRFIGEVEEADMLPEDTHEWNKNREPLETFKGYLLTSSDMWYHWVVTFLLFVIGLILCLNHNILMGVGVFLLSAGWVIFYANMFHYVEVGEEVLIIKHHYVWGNQGIYSLAQIREIVFEHRYVNRNTPNTIRLILQNYQSRSFIAATLKKQNWEELKGILEEKSVAVRKYRK